jgi:hypothetical protein
MSSIKVTNLQHASAASPASWPWQELGPSSRLATPHPHALRPAPLRPCPRSNLAQLAQRPLIFEKTPAWTS